MKQKISITTSNDKNLQQVLNDNKISVEDLNNKTKQAWTMIFSMLNLLIDDPDTIYIDNVETIDAEISSTSIVPNVSFCMRCYANSAVTVNNKVNFCNNCGSEGTCISITEDEANYLRETISNSINNGKAW